MENSREALFQRDIIEAITAYAWEVGIACGYNHKVHESIDASELELMYYRLARCVVIHTAPDSYKKRQ